MKSIWSKGAFTDNVENTYFFLMSSEFNPIFMLTGATGLLKPRIWMLKKIVSKCWINVFLILRFLHSFEFFGQDWETGFKSFFGVLKLNLSVKKIKDFQFWRHLYNQNTSTLKNQLLNQKTALPARAKLYSVLHVVGRMNIRIKQAQFHWGCNSIKFGIINLNIR